MTQKNDPLLLAIVQVKKMRKKKVNLSKLPRFLSPFFKTTCISDVLLTLRLKGTKKQILITKLEDLFGTVSFRVKSSKHSHVDFTIYAETNRELIEKLFTKFNFFN